MSIDAFGTYVKAPSISLNLEELESDFSKFGKLRGPKDELTRSWYGAMGAFIRRPFCQVLGA